MKSQFGLYRIHFGSEPVETSYDYETGKVGLFYCPIKLTPNAHSEIVNTIPLHCFYRLLQNHKDAIAVWNVNNSTIAILTPETLSLRAPNGDTVLDGEDLPLWRFDNSILLPEGKHIGYVRTYDKSKVVYHYPWYLYYNAQYNRFLDARFSGCKVEGVPMTDPPLSLYKELIATDYNAVYLDSITKKPVFLKGDFNV